MNDTSYHNKFARLYDYFQPGVKNDVNFYLNYFKNFRGKTLEIGAGTGRITIPLLKAGFDVIALDHAPAMLKLLKEKAKKENLKAKTICRDMRSIRSNEKFEAVIFTFRTFQHLYSVKDQFQTLSNVRKILKPGGVLIFDVYKPTLKWMNKGNWQWRREQNIKLKNQKEIIRIDYRNRYDLALQMMYLEYRFTYPNAKTEITPLQMRFFFRFEIEHLLKLTGFRVVELYGDFMKRKFTDSSREMIWIAERI